MNPSNEFGLILVLLPMGIIALGSIIGNYRVKRWIDLFVATFVVLFIEFFGLTIAFSIGIRDSLSDNKGLVFLFIPPALLISAPLIMLGLLIGWKLRRDSGTPTR